jgi:uroporphyrinogen decarboxylase
MMNSRERFLSVLSGKQPDRTPILANLTIQAAEKLAPILGKDVGFIDSFLATRISHRDILLALGNDAVVIAAARGKPTITLPDGRVKDEWGLVYKNVGLYSEAVERPLGECTTVEDVEYFEVPDPLAPSCWTEAIDTANRFRKDYAVVGDLEACLFELAWNLVGLEKFLLDLYTQEEYIEPLLDKIMDYSTKSALKMVDIGIDMIWAGDDFGTQSNLMISPELWRRHFKPRYQKLFATLKQKQPSLKIAYHTCGAVEPLIEEYIEIGLDFLNPLQPAAAGMELSSLSRKYGDRIGFFGGVDVQKILPMGSIQDVRNEVRRCINAVGDLSRYIIAPAHNIQPDTPVENILAFFDEAKNYRITEETPTA